MANAERWAAVNRTINGALEEIRAAFDEAYPDTGEEVAEALAEALTQAVDDTISEEYPEYAEMYEDSMAWIESLRTRQGR